MWIRNVLSIMCAGVLVSCVSGEIPTEPGIPVLDTAVVEGITFRASTSTLASPPAAVQTTITATNTSDRRVELWIAKACQVLLRVHRTPDRSGPAVWDRRRWLQATNTACPLALTRLTFAPGETRELKAITEVQEIVGDSLPRRQYYFSAIVQLSPEHVVLSAGDAELRR
jgi:hypothetical protein